MSGLIGHAGLLIGAATGLKFGLLSWWELDEASGNRLDSVGGRTMVPTGTVTSVAAKVGNGVQTAANAYLKTSASPNFATGDFTVAGVFKASNANMGIIGRNGAIISQSRQWIIGVDSTSAFFSVSTSGTANAASAIGSSGINNGAFHDYIAWRDTVANTINLQVDGGTVVTTAFSGATALYSAVDPGIYLSGIGADAAYLTGGVHDATGLWGRMLSSTERTFLRNSGAWRAFTDL